MLTVALQIFTIIAGIAAVVSFFMRQDRAAFKRGETLDKDHQKVGELEQKQDGLKTCVQNGIQEVKNTVQDLSNQVTDLRTHGSEPIQDLAKNVNDLKLAITRLEDKPAQCLDHPKLMIELTRLQTIEDERKRNNDGG